MDNSEHKQPYWAPMALKAMREKGLTQTDLTGVFGVSTRGAVGHYLRGRNVINVDQLAALSDLLGIRLDYSPPDRHREAISVDELSKLLDKWLFKFHQLKMVTFNADIEQLKGLIISDALENLGVDERAEEFKEYIEVGK